MRSAADGATALLSSHIVTDVEQACDRLMVLGVGRVLLHDTIADALASHWIATEGVLTGLGQTLGSFAGPAADRLTLVRAGHSAGEPACAPLRSRRSCSATSRQPGAPGEAAA